MRVRLGRGMIPAIAIAWTCVGSRPAAAEGPGVLVSPPTVEGQAPEHIVEALEEGIRGGLGDAGVTAAAAPEGCADTTCMAKAVTDGTARAYVATDVRIVGSDYALAVEIRGPNGQSLGRREGTCEICTYEEAAGALRELVAQAAAELPAPAAVAGSLTVTSVPAGATVRIDGTVVGTTPYEGSVDAGPHTVELSLDGHEPVTQPVEVTAGQGHTVELALDRQSRLSISPRTTTIVAFSAIGVGVALLAGGITLLVLDENPVKSNCSGVHVDADGDCEFRYDTLGGGIGLTVAGVAVAGAGAGLLLYSRKQQQRRGPAEVALVPGGLRARF